MIAHWLDLLPAWAQLMLGIMGPVGAALGLIFRKEIVTYVFGGTE